MFCPACRAQNDDGVRFCSSCGKPTAQQGAAPAAPPSASSGASPSYQQTGLRMCGKCGANVPPSMPTCMGCGGTTSTQFSIPAPIGGVNWVQVRMKVGCVQCGQRSPIDTFEMTGRYYCYGCNNDRQFDADMWHEKLIHIAAAIGDVFWTNTRFFPPWPPVLPDSDWLEDQDGWDDVSDTVPALMKEIFPKIANEKPRLHMEQEGTVMSAGGMKTGTFDVDFYPGHPLCGTCNIPYEIQFPARGVAIVKCVRCGLSETHRTPNEAIAQCRDVLAAIAPPLVEGRAPARMEQKAGTAAVAILCPQCGSALTLSPGSRMGKCQYCGTTALVPERAAMTSGTTPAPVPWWIAVYSPCTLRQLLSMPGAGRNPPDSDF